MNIHIERERDKLFANLFARHKVRFCEYTGHIQISSIFISTDPSHGFSTLDFSEVYALKYSALELEVLLRDDSRRSIRAKSLRDRINYGNSRIV